MHVFSATAGIELLTALTVSVVSVYRAFDIWRRVMFMSCWV